MESWNAGLFLSWESVASDLNAACALPTFAKPHYELGFMNYLLGDFPGAMEQFDQAVARVAADDAELQSFDELIQVVQDGVDVPLVLDSDNPDALLSAIKVYKGDFPIPSSINGQEERTEGLLLLAVDLRCGLIRLCMREDGIPTTPDGRLSIAARIVEHALAAGMQLEELYVDPLVMTVSADHRAGHLDLSTLRLIRQRFPQVRTISGVSNISFGLPKRRLLNRAFAAIPVSLGLDAYIVDVRDPDMMPMLLAARAVAGQDSRCRAYLKAYRAGRLGDILK